MTTTDVELDKLSQEELLNSEILPGQNHPNITDKQHAKQSIDLRVNAQICKPLGKS